MAIGVAESTSLHTIISDGLIRAAYQPIVDLRDGSVVAYEALARGPEGSPLEMPAQLFATARREGLEFELDWAAREAALRGALAAGLHPDCALFVNVEPSSFSRPAPEGLASVLRTAQDQLTLVTEITERDVTGAPATLLARAAQLRDAGLRLAIDDVGVDARSLALLPFVDPEIVKLDMSIVQTGDLGLTARTATAVRAHAERSGALIVAEGIETEAHRETALALGAHLGQGWLFGYPEPLPLEAGGPVSRPLRFAPRANGRSAETPFELLTGQQPPRRGPKDLLLRMSRALEEMAAAEGEASVVVSTFQEASFFTPATRRRYRRLAQQAALVGAIGVGLEETPEPGVRGASLWRSEPLRGEWDVCVVGPYFAGAFAARDLGDADCDDSKRRFDFVMTHDRDLVVAATRALIARIAPA